MKITERQLRCAIREALQESGIQLDDETLSRINDARQLFGDDAFIEEIAARIPRHVLAKALVGMFREAGATIGGVRYL